MGRLWRHNRNEGNESNLVKRASVIESPLFIALCPALEQVKSDVGSAYLASGYVYKNLRAMYRTQCYLNDLEAGYMEFPLAYRDALEWVYAEAPHEDESEQLSNLARDYENSQEGSFYAAILASNQTSKPLSDVDPRAALLTREGEMSQQVVLFKEEGKLFHGGDYNQRSDRDKSAVSLSRKLAKGRLDPEHQCLKAIVGEDIDYQEVGVCDARFTQAVQQFCE